MPTTSAHYPFISAGAKASFSDFNHNKQVIKERALAWEDKNGDIYIRDIIERLGWKQICAKHGEAVLFCANLQGMVNDNVFIRVHWVDISSSVRNNLLSNPKHVEDE